MEKKGLEYGKYRSLAKEYGFSDARWYGKKDVCLKKMKAALDTIVTQSSYIIEVSTGKEPCLNLNPSVYSGRIKGRNAGIYVAPTKAQARIVLNGAVYRRLASLYELPESKEKHGQYHFIVNFEGLCAFRECITTL